MALTKDQKKAFDTELKDFTAYVEELRKEVNLYKIQMKKSKAMEPYYQLALVLNSIRLINTCLKVNELSVNMLQLKNENFLNIARKEVYSIISSIEKIVGSDFENGLDENRELLDTIPEFNPLQRLNFIKALRHAIKQIIDSYGPNSKWKWSWPEIHFKLAVLAKNLFDFRAYEKENDLENPNYYIRKEYYDLIIELSNHAAQEYNFKYEQSTKDVGDLRKSVALMEMNRKIFQITGDTEDLGKTKTRIEAINAKIDALENEKNKTKKPKK